VLLPHRTNKWAEQQLGTTFEEIILFPIRAIRVIYGQNYGKNN
jgi:hypothetical protein